MHIGTRTLCDIYWTLCADICSSLFGSRDLTVYCDGIMRQSTEIFCGYRKALCADIKKGSLCGWRHLTVCRDRIKRHWTETFSTFCGFIGRLYGYMGLFVRGYIVWLFVRIYTRFPSAEIWKGFLCRYYRVPRADCRKGILCGYVKGLFVRITSYCRLPQRNQAPTNRNIQPH